MGTTSRGYPYPEGNDLVIGGDDAIQALAEAVNADVSDRASKDVEDVCVIARNDLNIGIGTTPGIIPWPGGVLALTGFSFDGQRLTYLGTTRTFLVMVEVLTNVEHAGSVSTTVEVRVNGNGFTGSHDGASRQDGGMIRRDHTHHMAVPVRLSGGDYIDVTASSNPAATIDSTCLRVYPMGPRA